MQMTAQDQLSYSIHQAEQQLEQEKSRPNTDNKTLQLQEKEVQVLKTKLALLPK